MGDDALASRVRDRFVAVNGDHPMTPEDDAYVREHFVPATPGAMQRMLDGHLPLPSYVLSDGTPMVPAAHGELAEIAGGIESLHDWFVAFWDDEPATGEAEWAAYLSGQYVCLRDVEPWRMRQMAERIADAQRAVEILRRDPHDEVGRGLLGQAVDGVLAVPGLDSMLLPMTTYDRLRFGGPTSRETWVDRLRAEYLTPVPPVLPLRTERLVLRPWQSGDEAPFAEAWADEDYASLLLTRTMNAAEVAEMVRRRRDPGDGRFVGLVVEHNGTVVGDSILNLQGTGLSEGEIGWTIIPRHAGKGYATEAANAVLELGFEHYGLRRIVANLDARNDRSAALCERLGMRREAHKVGDFWSKGRWTDSCEYALLRDEWRAARGR
ncbi:MAG TPA: GNAT family N-acetyltransferase [Nocardioides sp.]|nr:GNAT family N-acetyltransferase [Nocardioides sp.]